MPERTMTHHTVIDHDVFDLPAPDGTPLAVHHWSPADPAAAVFYLHGIQSHAGWLFETGPALAERGVRVYAVDRRGSGRSGGTRGDLADARTVLDDYALAFAHVRDRSPELPFTVVGQSLGGSVLAALLARGDLRAADAFVFCAPALGQQRARHGADGLGALRALTGTERVPVPLADEDYTDGRAYLAFMANDHLMLRQTTLRTRAAMVAFEDGYAAAPGPVTRRPVHLAVPQSDPIIDLGAARAVLARLAPQSVERSFPVRRHFLEFTEARTAYWSWLVEVALRDSCPAGSVAP
ncbi:Putative lysophospholipase [Streptomyces malaysiensis subsp. malaysiensis]|uniref:alpha/beta hydrolase n=1 Tax=Streptomyces malaysiensis TaxID=92644 RepID=UPI000CA3DDA6|nr:alpha/beta fold hydrolase [Streptomyces sp. M56]AUA08221.1 Putative lysophospholipase [Streptomyces sp. M56]